MSKQLNSYYCGFCPCGTAVYVPEDKDAFHLWGYEHDMEEGDFASCPGCKNFVQLIDGFFQTVTGTFFKHFLEGKPHKDITQIPWVWIRWSPS